MSSTGARARAVGVAVLAAGLVLAATTAPAYAHNVLISVSPADGSTIDVAPAAVVLTFDQPAQALGTEILVSGPGGAVVSTGKAILVNTTVSQELRDQRPAGTYTVTWRVTSADGHPVSGHFTFTATTGTGAAVATPTQGAATAAPATASRPPVAPGSNGGSAPWVIAAITGAGVMLAGATIWRRRRRRT